MTPIQLIIGSAILALVYGLFYIRYILRLPEGNDKMKHIAKAIQEGAKAYLDKQYQTIAIVAIVLFAIIVAVPSLGWSVGTAFLFGALLSAAAGYIGMNISVKANVRTAEAARFGMDKALDVAVKGGSVTGMYCCFLFLY